MLSPASADNTLCNLKICGVTSVNAEEVKTMNLMEVSTLLPFQLFRYKSHSSSVIYVETHLWKMMLKGPYRAVTQIGV